jgi:hypothetical protein
MMPDYQMEPQMAQATRTKLSKSISYLSFPDPQAAEDLLREIRSSPEPSVLEAHGTQRWKFKKRI